MKTFLSIGSGPGMGYATAERFAREGFRIVLAARSADKLQELAERLRAKGYATEVRAVDSSDPASVTALIADVEQSFGVIDVLHYNAASMRKATLAEQPSETFNVDLAVNVGGALAAAKAVAASMTARGAGSILLTGGGFSVQPHPEFLSLSIGKAGIRALTLGLFDAMKDKGVHVATVTVSAFVDPDSEAAVTVADLFWQLHSQPKAAWTAEANYPLSN